MNQNPPTKIVRFPQISELTSLSRTTIWRLESEGNFPKRLKVGNRGVGWLLNEVENWMRSRPRCNIAAV
jgi:prophage regulatory protein